MTGRRLLLALTLTLSALLASAGWLAATDSGLRAATWLATAAFGERLQISGAQGRLLGPLAIGNLTWTTPGLQISASGLELAWTPSTLARRHVQIEALHIATLRIDMPETAEPASPPDDLTLPLVVDAQKVSVTTLHWGDTLTVHDASVRLESNGHQHRLTQLSANVVDTSVSGEILLAGQAPFALQARAELRGLIAKRPLVLVAQADGALDRINLTINALRGITGEAQAALTPFAATPIAHAQVALRDIDPAAWQAGAPQARLAVTARLDPREDEIAGQFSITNPLTGPLDRQRLPLESAQGRLAWQADALLLSELTLGFAGGGTLKGAGRWASQTLTVDLDARRLDASRLISRLRPTRLAGPLNLGLGAERQRVHLALKDDHFTLQADAEHAGEEITVKRLELASGGAQLQASGTLSTQKGNAFSAQGELRQFDPSRFASLPEAKINARFEARGHIEPSPAIDARIELTDSRYAGLPLTGHGRVNIAWPLISQADITLAAGPNRLTAAGSFGRPRDRLTIHIDAPRLTPFGADGALRGQLELAGSADQPRLALTFEAPQLGYRGLGQVSGLSVRASLAGETDSPLSLDLSIARLDTAELPAFARALKARISGSNQTHHLDFDAEFAGSHHLRFAAEGGFVHDWRDGQWQGRLQELRLDGENASRCMRLRAPAPLSFGRSAWSFGPTELTSEAGDWQAELHAQTDARRLQASAAGGFGVEGKESRGRIDGRLEAGMEGPWKLSTGSPWQGRAHIETVTLAWLGELLGEGWQTGGRLTGDLQLAGTPAQPLFNGNFKGENLVLRRPEQGLHLSQGELAADLDDNLLRVSRLTFASELARLPRPLQLAAGDSANRFGEPGRLAISGAMRIDRNQNADSAFLDFQLDRVGAWQLPDQWLAVSGAGHLTWQAGVLGVRGKIGVDAGYWQLAPAGMPRLSDDVVIKRQGATQQPGVRPNLDLDVTADLGRRFLFSGAGLETRLTGAIRLSAQGRDLTRASGTVRTRDGRFDAYGQRLEIERGILSFQGLPDNPALDVRAVRKGLAVEPGVQIGGTAQRPVVRLVSDPELPDTDKLAWLVLGHGPESMGTSDATLLLSVAGGLLGNDSGNVVQQLKKTFGIDEFGFRQGDIGGSGGRQPTSRIAGSSVDTTATTGSQIFSVGKRLSSNAMLSYEQSLGTVESIIKLTVNLTRQVSVIARAGSDNALDIVYTLTFGQPPRRARGTKSTESEPAGAPNQE